MISYYCIVNMLGVPVREIAVFTASDDMAAQGEMERLAGRWPGFETVALYEGERSVVVLPNASLGSLSNPLELGDRAA